LLDERGLLRVSAGARCVFLDQFKGKDGAPLPVIVQKSDGGYLYATTDLAAVRHRCTTLAADRVMYFTDARQALHFQQIFAVAAAAGLVTTDCSLEHYPFGAMLGTDGRPFKTRAGGVIKLADLLDEAEERALEQVKASGSLTTAESQKHAARANGIGAVKYADLSKNRTSDYVFDWETMLALDGNTAPYLQYAYARIQSIFRRAKLSAEEAGNHKLSPPFEPAEHQLAVALLRLQEVAENSTAEGLPHYLCTYLYDLAMRFMRFYEACPILKAETDTHTRNSRLRLCAEAAKVLGTGLDLLGIETLQQM
jgi:arginyl-tRNA synthetase